MSVQVINEVFDPFQLGKPRDKSIEQYEEKPFYPVGGRDLSRYKNNTLRIVTKGLNQHLHLSEGYIEVVWQLASDPIANYIIIAGVNDTFQVAPAPIGTALKTATITPGSYTIGQLNTRFQSAINTAFAGLGGDFALANPGGFVQLALAQNDSKIALGTFGDFLGFTPEQLVTLVGGGGITALVNTQQAVMHDNALSLFRKASLYFNNVQVHSVDYPVFANTIRNLQDYSSDYVEKHREQWFYLEPESQNISTPLAIEKVSKTEGNLRIRTQIPLKRIFPFLETYDKVLRGVEVRLELERNEYNTSEIAYASRATPRITLNELAMWVPEVIGSPAVEAMLLEDVVNPREQVITYDHHEVYRQLNPPQGDLTWVIDTISEVPKFIYVGMQLRSQLDSVNPDTSTQINPSTFQNLRLVRAEARINGHVFPKMPYQISFADNSSSAVDEYNRLYWEFLRVNYKEAELDNGSLLEYTKQYKNVYPVITFNMSRDHDVQRNTTENNNVEIYLQFEQAPSDDFYIWADVVYENNMVLSTDGKNYEWRKI